MEGKKLIMARELQQLKCCGEKNKDLEYVKWYLRQEGLEIDIAKKLLEAGNTQKIGRDNGLFLSESQLSDGLVISRIFGITLQDHVDDGLDYVIHFSVFDTSTNEIDFFHWDGSTFIAGSKLFYEILDELRKNI